MNLRRDKIICQVDEVDHIMQFAAFASIALVFCFIDPIVDTWVRLSARKEQAIYFGILCLMSVTYIACAHIV